MTTLALSVLLSAAQAGISQPPIPLDPPQPLPPGGVIPQPLPPGAIFPEPLPPPGTFPAQPGVVPYPYPLPPAPVIFDGIPTHREFAAKFVPLPGKYQVCILHPRTCKPVEVCFELPDCGCPKVKVNWRMIEYDYGDLEVEIKFRLLGKVTVDYDD